MKKSVDKYKKECIIINCHCRKRQTKNDKKQHIVKDKQAKKLEKKFLTKDSKAVKLIFADIEKGCQKATKSDGFL